MDRSAVAEKLAREDDIEVAVLFGSAARGRLARESDVDIYIKLRRGVRWSAHRAQRLASDLSLVAKREVDLVIEDRHETSVLLRMEVARHGSPLFERSPGDWVELRAAAFVAYADLEPWMRRCAAGVRRRILGGAYPVTREVSGG